MRQHGQVFELNPSRGDGRMLWAYRYCTGGRTAKRIQRGGFACEQDARAALERALERLRRRQNKGRMLTLNELIEQYLAIRPGTGSRRCNRCDKCCGAPSSGGLLDVNPAELGVENPQRHPTDKRPFESWDEVEAVAARLRGCLGPMVIYPAATGLRPCEWVALEQRDLAAKASRTRAGSAHWPTASAAATR
jgi:hypothetical protein